MPKKRAAETPLASEAKIEKPASAEIVDSSEGVVFVFAHGAGAGSQHPWMQEWKTRLSTVGQVITFDYPKVQFNQAKLVASHVAAIVRFWFMA
jgi:predicted alpha/beta-hydrolase family hydrolase